MSQELCTPDTLVVIPVVGLLDTKAYVYGSSEGLYYKVASFASENAAQHFVRYAVERAKTFTGYRSE
jgi:hypothetical protein